MSDGTHLWAINDRIHQWGTRGGIKSTARIQDYAVNHLSLSLTLWDSIMMKGLWNPRNVQPNHFFTSMDKVNDSPMSQSIEYRLKGDSWRWWLEFSMLILDFTLCQWSSNWDLQPLLAGWIFSVFIVDSIIHRNWKTNNNHRKYQPLCSHSIHTIHKTNPLYLVFYLRYPGNLFFFVIIIRFETSFDSQGICWPFRQTSIAAPSLWPGILPEKPGTSVGFQWNNI